MLYCRYCGMPMEEDDVFCTRCGKSVDEDPRKAQSPPKMVSPGNERYGMEPSLDAEDETDRRNSRYIMIAAAAIIAAVFLGLISLLAMPSGKRGKDSDQDVVVYNGSGSAQEENMTQGQVQPASGENEEAERQREAAERKAAEEEAARKAAEEEAARKAAEEEAARKAAEEEAARKAAEEEAARKAAEEEAARKAAEEEAARKAEEAARAAEEAARNTPVGTDSSYVLAGTDTRYFTREELERLDDNTLQMAINEIYARHGRRFDTQSIQAYFDTKSWYRGTVPPSAFDGNEGNIFNAYETANRELMAQIRNERSAAAAAAQTQTPAQ